MGLAMNPRHPRPSAVARSPSAVTATMGTSARRSRSSIATS